MGGRAGGRVVGQLNVSFGWGQARMCLSRAVPASRAQDKEAVEKKYQALEKEMKQLKDAPKPKAAMRVVESDSSENHDAKGERQLPPCAAERECSRVPAAWRQPRPRHSDISVCLPFPCSVATPDKGTDIKARAAGAPGEQRARRGGGTEREG